MLFSVSCHFRNHCRKYTQFRDESPFQAFPFHVNRGSSWKRGWSADDPSTDSWWHVFTAFLVADSPTRIPRARFGWIRIRKLEATTTRRRRGSPVCKKELSSNRINDPLASIYRARRRDVGVGHNRRDAQGRTRRTVFGRTTEAAAVSPRRPFAAQTPCAENIICFLAVPGSLCRRPEV